jgi:hypothetical protein
VNRGWKHYDLYCRTCGNVGSLGIWTEQKEDEVRWDGEWKGFFGVTEREGPLAGSVTCAACREGNVEVTSVLLKKSETS